MRSPSEPADVPAHPARPLYPLPSAAGALRVWARNARVFSKIWKGALLPQFFDPAFYLVALGFGLGTYLARIHGVPYRDFIAPGLCGSAVMWAASFETTWNVFFKMEETRLYDAFLTTPIEVEDLVTGELLWGATRALVYGTSFLVVITLFGFVHSPWAIVMPPFLLLGGACFSALGLTFTSLISKMDYYAFFFTLFITPMFLFGGIFFPYDRLPDWAQAVAWLTPLYHLVAIARGLAMGPDALALAGHAAWLVVVTLALWAVPVRAMRRRLVA
jgi:lipooligosaccharide transport system permease protein